MGKTRDPFKKIRDTKGRFHAKMGTKKDRNGMDLTEAEDSKKRWQEYTEELYCGTSGKESPCNAGDQGLIPGLRRLPTPGFFPGKFHGQRSLADYSPLD